MVAARFGVGGVRRSQAAQEQEQDAKIAKVQADIETRLSQVDGFRSEFFMQLARYSRGLAKWQESGFAWEEPDWDTDPETWGVPARVLYRMVQLNTYLRNIGWLQSIGRPGLCQICKEAGLVPAPTDSDWFAYYCPDHERGHAIAGVKLLARQLFDCDADARDRKERQAEERVEVARIDEEVALFERLK